ncbi:MAG: AraC family transcriptional regulator ligand-binding domain-containing protein [Polyangiales bacterium]
MSLLIAEEVLRRGRQRNADRTMLAALLQSFLLFGVKHGIDPVALCAEAGIRMPDIADADKQVPHAWFFALRAGILRRLPDKMVAVELGTFVTPDQMGYLGLAVKYGANGRDATQLIARCLRLVDSNYEQFPLRFETEGALAGLHVPAEALGPPDPPECVESLFVNCVHTLKHLIARDVVPREVSFAHDRDAAYADKLSTWFRCPVRFNQHAHVFRIDAELLEAPCIHADTAASKHFEAQIERMLVDRREPFIAQVERMLAARLATGAFSQDDLARALALSTRTMQRKLKELGVSYQELLSQVRRRMAEGLLREGTHPIFEIAFALGYDDVSSFSRAFRSWTGLSPQAFRQQGTQQS